MATNNAINNLLFPNVTSVNSATVLTVTAYGTNVICTGATSYALTLPTVTNNSNKFITVTSRTTSFALVTITPASGTIAGQPTLAIGSGDSLELMNDGTNWWVVNQWLQPVNVKYFRNGTQSIPNNTPTAVIYNQGIYDPYSFMNTTTGLLTVRYPGVYHVTVQQQFTTSAVDPLLTQAQIWVNGGQIYSISLTTAANDESGSVISSFLVLNGSTDTVNGYAYQNSGGALDIISSPENNINVMRISLF